MKRSCCWALVLALVFAGMCVAGATAENTPQTKQGAAAKTHHTTRHRAAGHKTTAKRTTKRTSQSRKATTSRKTTAHSSVRHKSRTHAKTAHASTARSRSRTRRVSYRHRYYQRWKTSSYAKGDIFADDITAGEDSVVRQAAIDAMGEMNGTAVVINPANGRILAMVNQKMALSPGAEPCSTIKLSVALAALSEGIVTRDTMVKLPGFRMNMTEAIAHSNNLYFEKLGRELGFERVRHYAKEFGLGELAGYHIRGEQLGKYPEHVIPASQGGVGRMCSFGQGVSLTPLQLGALISAIANGGTLYYLQHPTTQEQAADFVPRIKRKLNIARYIPEVEDGMAAAVEYGTARSLRVNFTEFPVFGKTGTCSNKGTRFGWFGSFSETPQGKLVTVFLLEGGRPTYGPYAANLTGEFYKHLQESNYFRPRSEGEDQTASADLPARGTSE